jgi:IS30 family transposase
MPGCGIYARNEPQRSLPEAIATAFLGIARISSVGVARRVIQKQYGRGSLILSEFNRLLAQQSRRKAADRRVNDEQRKEILALSAHGWSAARIALKIHVRCWRVGAVLREARRGNAERENLSEDTTCRIIKALERGSSTIAEIAAEVGCRPDTILRIARRHRSAISILKL